MFALLLTIAHAPTTCWEMLASASFAARMRLRFRQAIVPDCWARSLV